MSKNYISAEEFEALSDKEEEPDEIDLQMLKAIDNDPECHEFVKESDINWD